MIIADLLKHRLFPDFEFIAGSSGLNREISAVSVIDAPDVDRWMRGGEFLIGSGYIFRDAPNEFIPFLRRANKKGTAAIGIKLDRYLHNLPDNLVDVADELSLPLFRIPLNYRWTDVIEIVHNYLMLEKQRVHQDAAVDRLGNFWGEEFDIKELLLGFAQQLQRPMLVTSEQLNLNHCFTPNGKIEDAETSHLFPKVSVTQEKTLPMQGQIIGQLELQNTDPPAWNVLYKIASDTPITMRMRLASGEQTPSKRQERLVLRAMTMLRAEALEIAVQFSKQMAKRERFFEGLCLDVYSDLGMINANLRDMGVKIPQTSRIVMVSPINESSSLNWQGSAALNYKLGNIWVGLVPFKDSKAAPSHEYETLTKEEDVFVAFGSPVLSPLEIGRSYREARRTLSWARNFSLNAGIYQYDELTLYALLDSLIRLPEAIGVWKRYWEPLIIDGSQKKKSISMRELAVALIEADFNARLCSVWLHLHYNTVRNYIEDLQHLLGLDLNMPHHQLGLTLGYYIEKSRKRNDIELISTSLTAN